MTVSYHSGIDCFASDLDKESQNLVCLACRTKLEKEKSNGPRSFAGAMADSKSEHWSYYCPNTKYKGHSHLVGLYKEANSFTSRDLRTMVLHELDIARASFLNDAKVEE